MSLRLGTKIIAGSISDTSAFATKTDYISKAEVSSVHVVIKTYTNGANGYRIWSDGFCEQWGKTNPSVGVAKKNVTLLKPYKDTNYFVLFGNEYTTTATANACVETSTKTNLSFVLIDSTVKTYYTYWMACGYLNKGQY